MGKEFEQLAEQVKKCTDCDLRKSRKNAVTGYGNPNAKIMIIGEAPGEKEEQNEKPFFGASGKTLGELLLNESEIKCEDCYITNMVKCRPVKPKTNANRKPSDKELMQCSNFVYDEIKKVNPKIILLVGKTAAKLLPEIKNKTTMKNIRTKQENGYVFKYKEIPVFIVYHTSAKTDKYQTDKERKEDFRKFGEFVRRTI
jgi:DNA polymerase